MIPSVLIAVLSLSPTVTQGVRVWIPQGVEDEVEY